MITHVLSLIAVNRVGSNNWLNFGDELYGHQGVINVINSKALLSALLCF